MKKKTQLSSFDIMVMVKELHSTLLGGFIDKVYQPQKDVLSIRITIPKFKENKVRVTETETTNSEIVNSRYKHLNLIIKFGKYLHIEPKSENQVEQPSSSEKKKNQPRPFAMLLRKYLKNGKIKNIYQHEFDRIIVIEIDKKESYRLLVEVFGDGNIILVKDEKIIQPLFPHTWSARALRAGEVYKFPPTRNNPKTIDFDEFSKIFNESDKDLVRTLIMDIDIPGKFAEELCKRTGLEKKEKATQIQNEDKTKIFEILQYLFNKIETEPKAFLVYENEKTPEPFELMPIKLEIFKEFFFRELISYNEAVREFFNPESDSSYKSKKLEHKALAERESAITQTSSEESRLTRQLEQQKSAFDNFLADIKSNHELGETIYGNYQRCEELLNQIKELRSKVAPDEILEQISKMDDIIELNPHMGFVILRLKTIDGSNELDVKLNLRKNVIENANIYYDNSKRAKEKLRGTEKAMKKTETALLEIGNKLKSYEKIEIPKAKPALGKHFWFEKYHWLITSAGNLVVAGRDARSNDQVVKKYLKEKDRYCHADLSGAPSVVVKHDADSTEISEESLQQACEFGLLFSKAWNAKVGAGSAYWVTPSQVSKTPQSGEFLARGAFVIRGKRNYIGNIKLELGLGEITYQGKRKLMAGPVSPVKVHAKRYVVLVPGDVKKNVIAKELSELFNVVVDDVLSVLPSGEFKLVEKVGF